MSGEVFLLVTKAVWIDHPSQLPGHTPWALVKCCGSSRALMIRWKIRLLQEELSAKCMVGHIFLMGTNCLRCSSGFQSISTSMSSQLRNVGQYGSERRLDGGILKQSNVFRVCRHNTNNTHTRAQ